MRRLAEMVTQTDTSPYRVLVTGSRGWVDRIILATYLDKLYDDALMLGRTPMMVVHGACPQGADYLAMQWVYNRRRTMAYANMTVEEPHAAQWSNGKRAGYDRNQEMVDLGADVCLAFAVHCTRCSTERPPHPTHGTAHCARMAERAGIRTVKVGDGWGICADGVCVCGGCVL